MELNGQMEPVTCLSASRDIGTFVKSRNSGKTNPEVKVIILRKKVSYSALNMLEGIYVYIYIYSFG